MNRVNEIIKFAHDLSNTYKTHDPFIIAKEFGFAILTEKQSFEGFMAHTINIINYPTTIVINGNYSHSSQIVLCAHELGHAFLHINEINHFRTTAHNAFTNVEYEANLFAVAFLFDEEDLNMPLRSMPNYLLKSILDYNIK